MKKRHYTILLGIGLVILLAAVIFTNVNKSSLPQDTFNPAIMKTTSISPAENNTSELTPTQLGQCDPEVEACKN